MIKNKTAFLSGSRMSWKMSAHTCYELITVQSDCILNLVKSL